MADEDLSKFSIDKGSVQRNSAYRKRALRTAALAIAAVIIVVLLTRMLLMPVVTVESAAVSRIFASQSFTLLNASGYVVAQRKAAVASKATGRIVSILVEEGNRVKKGDLIARLESDDLLAARQRAAANLRVSEANHDQAKAELSDAAANQRRSSGLIEKGFISQLEYDAAFARYKKAEAAVAASEAAIKSDIAALREAEVNLEYTFIRAPFDAVVLTKNADIGDIVTPLGAAANAKAAVVTIADMGSLQVEVDVSESSISQVRAGQPCEIQLDAVPDTRFRGEVHMIVPTADRTKATVLVKIRFLDRSPLVLPEMSAKVAFLERPVQDMEMKPKTAVSPGAIAKRGDRAVVFLIREDRVVETPVTPGEKVGDMVEILSGVQAGDRIVRSPDDKLRDGTRIKVLEK